jgi:hypothetical protein
MPTPLTLSTAPLEHPAMDYAFLRQEGIRHLERLAGSLWTDFNAHDPGITILEQLCYALTDLAYRINYELPDLLARANEDTSASLYSPGRVLTSESVTPTDLRQLVIDVAGVKNAWIERVEEQQTPLYFAEGEQQLSVTAPADAGSAVTLSGLYRVLIEKSDLDDIDGTAVQREVTRRLHAHRNLCEDFEEIRILPVQPVAVHARIEIGQVDDAEDLLARIYQCIAEYISPTIRFHTLSELLAAGKPVDEIFEGPWLERGFIDVEELRRLQRRTALRTSDLIREIMDVPGVRAVRDISLAVDTKREPWSINLDPEKTPKLALRASTIGLERNQLQASVNLDKVRETYEQRLRTATTFAPLPPEERDLRPPRGRDRGVGRYHSIQHQFPAAYGIGEMGLPDSAPPQRKAQAKQLKAYLMFFDQLLANYFAQLAVVKDLFSFNGATAQTYFWQALDEPGLRLNEVLRHDASTHLARLQQMTENPHASVESAGAPPRVDPRRKNRFLNHLIARFAEQFTDYSLLLYGAMAEGSSAAADKLIVDKQRFLKDYARISSARGTGFNYLAPWSDANRSGLESRVKRKLGMNEEQEEECFVVEHLLLRPMEDDKEQQAPLLAQARRKDPFSLQLSFVFPNWPRRFRDPSSGFRQFVEKVVREETPAHLTVYVQWLDKEAMTGFVAAYKDWVNKRCEYWQKRLGTEGRP